MRGLNSARLISCTALQQWINRLPMMAILAMEFQAGGYQITKVHSFYGDSCAILISFKIVVLFNTTSADIKTKSADVILKSTTILKDQGLLLFATVCNSMVVFKCDLINYLTPFYFFRQQFVRSFLFP